MRAMGVGQAGSMLGHATTGGAAGPAVTERGPVVVLASPDSGGQRLMSLLSATGELACTTGTGVLPLCDQAVQVWRRVENGGPRAGRLSPLAAKSIRASITPLVIHILATSGAQRWCECAIPAPEAAEAFLTLFPGTRFVALHRHAGQVIRSALARSPWGLAGQAYRPFIAAHPASTLTALAAYWATHTEALLAFERDHPDACLRVRYEDLPAAGTTPPALAAFLGLAATSRSWPDGTDDDPMPSHPDAQPPAPLPLDQLPPAVLAQVNNFLTQLGYPTLTPG